MPFKLKLNLLLVILLTFFGCSTRLKEKQSDIELNFKRADSLFWTGKYYRAKDVLYQSLPLTQDIKNDSITCEIELLLGMINRKLGYYDSAIAVLQNTIGRAQNIKDKKLELRAKILLAEICIDLELYSETINYASDAEMLARYTGDFNTLFKALFILKRAHRYLHQPRSEKKILNELLSLDLEYLLGRNQLVLFEEIFNHYADLQSADSVYRIFEMWLSHAKDTRNKTLASYAYLSLGIWQYSRSQYDSALRSFSKAMELSSIEVDTVLEWKILYNLAKTSFRTRKYVQARQFFQDLAKQPFSRQNPAAEIIANLAIMICDWKIEPTKSPASLDSYARRSEEFIRKAKTLGFKIGEAYSIFLRGLVADKIQDINSAHQYYLQALECYEKLFYNNHLVEYIDLITLFLEDEGTGWYDALIKLYCSSGNVEDAVKVIERKNLDDLNQFFLKTQIQTHNQDINFQISKFHRALKSLSLIDKNILLEIEQGNQQDIEYLNHLKERFREQLVKLEELRSEFLKKESPFAWLLTKNQISLKDIKNNLPPNTALIYFALSDSELYILVVKHDESKIQKVSISKKHILGLIEEYNRLIGDIRLFDDDYSFNNSGSLKRITEVTPLIYRFLINQMEHSLSGLSKLYIILPKEFGWLPVHTLQRYHDGKMKYLIELFNVSYLPSATVLLFPTVEGGSVSRIAGFGHSGDTNWDVEYELKDVRSFYENVKLFFGKHATIDQLSQTQYDVLNIVAEFNCNQMKPFTSGMIISDGRSPFGTKTISIGEMFLIRAPSILIFSNISPSSGSIFRYASMAFLVNGSRHVIATMWQGDRKAKKYFGEIFYTRLLEKSSSSEAYYDAVISLIKSKEFSQPHRWGLYYQFGK